MRAVWQVIYFAGAFMWAALTGRLQQFLDDWKG